MRSQIIALGLAGSAFAAYQPPAYEETSAPSYGAETTTPSVPSYGETTSAPAPPTYETPSVPSYGSSSSSESKPAEYPTTSAPAYYPTTTEVEHPTEYTTIPCESTTVTYGPSTWVVSTKTTLTVPVTKPYETHPAPTYPVSKSTPYSPEQPSSSVDVPVYTPAPSASWTTKPVAPYYPTGGNATATYPAGTGSPSASSTHPASYTGAASKAAAGVMVGVSGLIAALFL